MYQNLKPIYFILGLGSFLISHVWYVVVYLGTGEDSPRRGIHKIMTPLLPVYGIGLLAFLWPHLGELLIPVILYAAIICTMGITASRRRDPNTISYWMMLVGALLFILSDSILAINKFYTNYHLSGVSIMLTYILAQYAIVKGLVYYFTDRS